MLYDRPISALMKDAAAELTPPYRVPEIIAWFAEHYPKVKASSVRAHVTGLTANNPNRHHYTYVAGLPAVFTRLPDKTLVPFEPPMDGDLEEDDAVEALEGDDREGDEAAGGVEFVLETHLEEFLVTNWEAIDWGRPLQVWTGRDGQSGHQLPTPLGRLDFLCIDAGADVLVVVELKRGRPSDKVVGQVARYIGYVRNHLAKPGQAVEGLIIAHESDEALRYAVSALPGLRLMTYEVAFNLQGVSVPATPPESDITAT